MATAAYWQRGEALDYTNSDETTIPVNTIVAIGSRIGITGAPIAPSETGVLHVGGVWEMPKTGAAAISMGTVVYFDGTGITYFFDKRHADGHKSRLLARAGRPNPRGCVPTPSA